MSSDDFIKTSKTLALAMEHGTLVDFETTGIPDKTPTWEVVTLGYMSGNQVVIVQRKSKAKQPFYAEIVKTLAGLPRPFFAYNASFERDIMKNELGIDVADSDFIDLMLGWRYKADEIGEKWPSVSNLMGEREDYFGEPKVTGSRVPDIWDLYASKGIPDAILSLIAEHCLNDILREAVLLLRYPEHSGSLASLGDKS